MLEEKLERSVEQSAAALTAMADDFYIDFFPDNCSGNTYMDSSKW